MRTLLATLVVLLAACASHLVPEPVPGVISDASVCEGAPLPTRKINVPAICPECDKGARLFAYSKVADAVEAAYKLSGGHSILIQDASYPNGEKMSKHKGHMSGTVVDLSVPLTTGPLMRTLWDRHGYNIRFDEDGRRTDKPGQIDWAKLAHQIVTLNKVVLDGGGKIQKIIFEPDMQDNLLATKHRAELETITFNDKPLLPRLHDNHYHADIRMPCPPK